MVINNRTSSTSELDPLISNSSEGSGGDRSSQTTVRTYALAALAAQIDRTFVGFKPRPKGTSL